MTVSALVSSRTKPQARKSSEISHPLNLNYKLSAFRKQACITKTSQICAEKPCPRLKLFAKNPGRHPLWLKIEKNGTYDRE